MALETIAYTNPTTGVTITFGDSSLPNVIFNGITGIGLSPVDNFVVDTAYQPGAQFVRTKKKPTVLTVHLVVQGTDKAGTPARVQLYQTIDAILGILDPQITAAGSLIKTLADGTQRKLNNVQYVGGFEVKDQAANYAYITLDLVFEGYDPTWYSASVHSQVIGASSDLYGFQVPISVPLTLNGQASGSAIATNQGNIISHPTFTFNGPCQNYSVLNKTTGESFAITQALGAGDTLVVDTGQGVITWTPSGGVATQLYSSFSGAKQWIRFLPGNNSLQFQRDVAGNNQCTVSWSDAWNHG